MGSPLGCLNLSASRSSGILVGTAQQQKNGLERKAAELDPRNSFKSAASSKKLLSALLQQGRYDQAIRMFEESSNDLPDNSFLAFCSCFSDPDLLQYARKLHSMAVSRGVDSNPIVGIAMLNMFVKAGSLAAARQIFDRIPSKSTICWTSMMSGYGRHRRFADCHRLFREMLLDGGAAPNLVTFITVLASCSAPASLRLGSLVHRLIIGSLGSVAGAVVAKSLVNMYGKCGDLESARRVFDRLDGPGVATWTAMIASYAHHGKLGDAFLLLKQMDLEGRQPNQVTFFSVLRACSSGPEARSVGELIHACVVDLGFDSELRVGSSLVNMYAKSGRLDDARQVFDGMSSLDVTTWNCLISAYPQSDRPGEALVLFRQMQLQGFRPNPITIVTVLDACTRTRSLATGSRIHQTLNESCFETDLPLDTALMTFYGKCGQLGEAVRIFNGLGCRDTVTWTSMLGIYEYHGDPGAAMHLFRRMVQEGVDCSRTTLLTAVNLCSSSREVDMIHSCIMEKTGRLDQDIGNALISAFGRYKSPEAALCMFKQLPQKDVVSWTALVASYTEHGDPLMALEVFREMKLASVEPNRVTYLALLDACSSLPMLREVHKSIPENLLEADEALLTGLVSTYAKCGSLGKARDVFSKLKVRDTALWTSMIAASARNGQPSETLELFRQMQQEGVEPDQVTCTCVLSACSHRGNLQEGLDIFLCIGRDWEFSPTLKHYACAVDILGRAGQLKQAEAMIQASEFKLQPELWRTLLAACKVRGDVQQGTRAAERLLQTEPDDTTVHLIFSHIVTATQ